MNNPFSKILNDEKKFNEFAQKTFNSIDTDSSGEIDFKELETIMTSLAEEMGGSPPTKEEIHEVFDELDTDKSGSISFEEFKVLAKDLLQIMINI